MSSRPVWRSEAPAAQVPIIAATADTITRTPDEYRQAGIQGFVTKPISLRFLLEAIDNALGETVHTPNLDAHHQHIVAV